MSSYDERRAWIFSHISVRDTKRRVLQQTSDRNRTCSRFYCLPDQDGEDHFVCLTFFLRTLGYTSPKIIKHMLSKCNPQSITTPHDQRGRHAPANKLSEASNNLIEQHILSYHPAVSHYRREHAPRRRYLPPELSIKGMYDDFNMKHPDLCSIETYRRKISAMNISFVKLGEEECETCVEFKQHQSNHTHVDMEDCALCKEHSKHLERARIARDKYREDKEREPEEDEVIISSDMQKVIMLPRMPGIKNCCFTKRVVCFNQTFAPLGGRKKSGNVPVAVLWDESICGRNAEDVASAYVKFIRHANFRDKAKFLIYADNCTAQNKNWIIFTAMVNEVNLPTGPDQIIFRFFEKGHTFMSADSFHHQIEKGMRAAKSVYDRDDFTNIVSASGIPVNMIANDFINYENGVSQGAYTNKPVLAKVHEVKFVKGSTKLYWKNSIDDEEYEEGDFLKKKVVGRIEKDGDTFSCKTEPRGVNDKKKNDLIANLCRFMPLNRQKFWIDLPTSQTSSDLLDSD